MDGSLDQRKRSRVEAAVEVQRGMDATAGEHERTMKTRIGFNGTRMDGIGAFSRCFVGRE